MTLVVAIASQLNSGGNCAVSTDGINYTVNSNLPKALNGTESSWAGICYSPDLNLFCAVASNGATSDQRTGVSSDGVTWLGGLASSANLYAWKSVCWSKALGLFCVVSTDGHVMTSPDGRTWTQRTAAEANAWQCVCWSDALGLFCAVASAGTHQVMTSPDGVIWTARTHAITSCNAVVWEPVVGKFCAIGGNSTSQLSSDGINWTSYAANLLGGTFHCVCTKAGGGFVGGGHNSEAASSSTGQASWTGVSVGNGGFIDIQSIIYDANLSLYIAACSSGTDAFVTSPDLVTWTPRLPVDTNPWVAIASGTYVPPPITRGFGRAIF